MIRVTVAHNFALAAQQKLLFDFTAKAAARFFFGVEGSGCRGGFNGKHRWGQINADACLRLVVMRRDPVYIR